MTSTKGMLPCPGCHTPLPPDATGCGICLRTRTKQEIVRGYAHLRQEEARRRALPYKIAGAVVVVSITVFFSWDNRAKLLELAGRAREWTARKYERFIDANSYVPKDAEPLMPVAVNPADLPKTDPHSPFAQNARPPAPPPVVEAFRGVSPPPPRPAAVSEPAPPAPKRPPAKSDWRIRGRVYDLATLKPVADAEVVFLRGGRSAAAAKTNGDGEYEVDVAMDDGLTVNLRSAKHKPGQIVDADPPYRSRDADERRATLQNATVGDLAPAPVSFPRTTSRARLDLVAVPEAWPDR